MPLGRGQDRHPEDLRGRPGAHEPGPGGGGGEILAVSQFTLAGSLAKGRRPSFDRAMAPDLARPLFDHFVACLRAEGCPVRTGFFQETMEVELVNDGPVTFVLERSATCPEGPA